MILLELLALLEGDHKETRAAFLKKQIEPKWDGVPGEENLDKFLAAVAEADPSLKGIYMQWIAQRVLKSEDNRVEDFSRLKQDLISFDKKEIKAKLEKKDINAYKNFSDLGDAIDAVREMLSTPEEKAAKAAAAKLAAKELAQAAKKRADIDTVYDGGEGWIKVPKTKMAAQFLGQSTKWCTSAKANNMFDRYNATDSLFVIYDKKTKQRHQLHIEDGQFADVRDKNVGMGAVPQWAWDPILEWYKKNSNLSLKQIITIGHHAKKDDLAKGTDHEDLFDMMKEFGVI